jgi:hypothetical protein
MIPLLFVTTSNAPEVSWIDGQRHLSLSVAGGDSLDLKLVEDGEVTRFSIRHPQGEWKVALPIAVKGQKGPQVLTEMYRPNWLVIQLWSCEPSDVHQTFGIAVRDGAAIRWHVSKGGLESFELFDRWMPLSERRLSTEHGKRWQVHSTYRFSKTKGSWVELRRVWERYVFGQPCPGTEIQSASDCKFLFRSKTG